METNTTDTTTPALVGIGLARGVLIHLTPAGGTQTLCGRRHQRNPRYVRPGSLGILPAEQATCPRCQKVSNG